MNKLQSDSSQSFDTLSAQSLLNQTPVLQKLYLLQVGLESALGGFHRMAAALTKGCRLATSLTFSHWCNFLSDVLTFWCGGNITTSPSVHQLDFTIGELQNDW
jgi:hypothetical protein